MNTLGKEFIPYEQALDLKELGFDEPCFRFFLFSVNPPVETRNLYANDLTPHGEGTPISAPTFSQAFRFFREKYKLHSIVVTNLCSPIEHMWFMYQIGREGEGDYFKKVANFISYEEAELECLKNLIEIVKNK